MPTQISGDTGVSQIQDGAVVAADLSAGMVVQVVEATPYTTASSTTAVIPLDSTLPQITEGQEFITVSITPKAATNRLRIEASIGALDGSTALAVVMALFQDALANAIAGSVITIAGFNYTAPGILRHEQAAGTTSPITFRLRIGPNAGTCYLNRRADGITWGGMSALRLSVTEVKA